MQHETDGREHRGLPLSAALLMALLASTATGRSESFGAADAENTSQSLPTEASLQSSIKDLTDTSNGIRNERDSILSTPARMTRDSHGRTLADDMRQNVLVQAVHEQVDSLLRAADDSLSAHDLRSTNAALAEVAMILEREQDTYNAISAYWKWHATPRANRTPYLNNLRVNGLQAFYSKEIEAAEASFDQQIESRLFVEAMNTTLPMLLQLYEKAAVEEAAQVHRALERRDFVPFKTQDGSAKCAHATSKNSGSSQPIMVSNTAIDDYYPPASRDLREEGLVLVDVLVARNGCPERAWVTASSGYERLDDAALSYALHARYRPAQSRGRLVAIRLPLTVKFELPDD